MSYFFNIRLLLDCRLHGCMSLPVFYRITVAFADCLTRTRHPREGIQKEKERKSEKFPATMLSFHIKKMASRRPTSWCPCPLPPTGQPIPAEMMSCLQSDSSEDVALLLPPVSASSLVCLL